MAPMINARATGGIMNTDTNRIKSSLSNIFLSPFSLCLYCIIKGLRLSTPFLNFFYLSHKKKISNPKYTTPNKRLTIFSIGETLKKQASDRIPTSPTSARIKIMMLRAFLFILFFLSFYLPFVIIV